MMMKSIGKYKLTVLILSTLTISLYLTTTVDSTESINLWNNQGVEICTVEGNQFHVQVVSDGRGGTIIVWDDHRDQEWKLYAQRINSLGIAQWNTDGIRVCTADGDQQFPCVVPDGANGAIISWIDYRNGTTSDIYAQRINSDGELLWDSNGVPICVAQGTQHFVTAVYDGNGGAIFSWRDLRNEIGGAIYSQRINHNGEPQWQNNGIIISTAPGYRWNPQITTDGAGGAIICWWDERKGTGTDIYAQRINSNGGIYWEVNGKVICSAVDNQKWAMLTTDGDNGAVIVWEDWRNDYYTYSNCDIYAQRISADGVLLWSTNGVPICTLPGYQDLPQIISDAGGNYIITWEDKRNSNTNGYDIYAQRINLQGDILWSVDGVPICVAEKDQYAPHIVSNNTGGAIISWYDLRDDPNNWTNYDVYTQYINANGEPQWQLDGYLICEATENQFYPQIVSDGTNGAIIVWEDWRNGNNKSNIIAQRINNSTIIDISFIDPPTQTTTGTVTKWYTRFQNLWGTAQQFQYWLTFTGPISRSLYQGEYLLEPYDSLTIKNTIRVPQNTPPGEYLVTGYTGVFPDVPWHSDDFNCTVTSKDKPSIYGSTLLFTPINTFPNRVYNYNVKHPAFTVCYPNPLNTSSAHIYYYVTPNVNYYSSGYNENITPHVNLKIYNVNGSVVCTLVNEPQRTGLHRILWKRKTDHGSLVSPGVYLCSLTIGNNISTINRIIILP